MINVAITPTIPITMSLSARVTIGLKSLNSARMQPKIKLYHLSIRLLINASCRMFPFIKDTTHCINVSAYVKTSINKGHNTKKDVYKRVPAKIQKRAYQALL